MEFTPDSVPDSGGLSFVPDSGPPQQSPTAIDRAARAAGVVARGATTGVLGLPLLLGQGLNQLYNVGARAVGADQRPSVMEGFNTFLNNAGLPEPASGPERLASAISSGMAGSGGQLAAVRAATAAPGSASSLIQDLLLTQPVRQVVAGGTSAAASDIAGAAGAGPVGQTVAGLAGGALPFSGQFRTPTPEAARTAETAQAGRNLGLVYPPSQSNPGAMNDVLTGRIAGRSAVEQVASGKNQQMVNEAFKQDLGIPRNQAATISTLRAIRSKEGQPYVQISNMGGSFSVDSTFKTEIANAAQQQRTVAASGLGLEDPNIINVAQKLENASQYDGRTLIELTKTLRDKQTQAFRAGETGAGRFYHDAVGAVEDLIGRNLKQLGRPELLDKFRNARAVIAKTYSAESALNDATGNFDPNVIARQYDAGLPLSGRMAVVGRVANTFPGAFHSAESAAQRQAGGSVIDTYAALHGLMAGGAGAGVYGYATHSPLAMGAGAAMAAMPLIRPGVRSMILSGPYQDAFAVPNTGLSPAQASGLAILNTQKTP